MPSGRSFPWWTVGSATLATVAAGVYWLHRQQKRLGNPDDPQLAAAAPKDLEGLISERFAKCIQHLKAQKLLASLPRKSQLQFYALYKQATLGNCCEFGPNKLPPAYDLVATAKFQAWSQLEGTSRSEAMQQYIDLAVQLEFTRSMMVSDDDDGEDLEGDAVLDVGGMGNKPSTLAGVTDDDEEEALARAAEDQAYPLHAAARVDGVEELLRLLTPPMAAGTTMAPQDVDQRDASGQTALHLAADGGNLRACQVLIKHGANVCAADHDGISVLQAAVIAGHAETCKLLCVLGANPDQPDCDGDTPRACADDDPVLKEILIQASAGTLDETQEEDFHQELQPEEKGIGDPTDRKSVV